VLPEGASLLAAKPKVGKSLLALNVALSVSTGGMALGKVPVDSGRVLFLALEGSKRGLKRRLDTMLQGDPWPGTLHFARTWRRLDDGGLDDLRTFLDTFPDTRLVVVDTLKKVRARTSGRRNMYDEDYEALEGLVALSVEYGVSVLIIHHTRKGSSEDPLDEVSGSTGLTGAVDNTLVLRKERGQVDATLTVIPREEEEAELALTFDARLATWVLAGNAEDFAKTQERQAILDVLRQAKEAMRAKDVADVLGVRPGNVSFLLGKMLDEGTVQRPRYGFYSASTAVSAQAEADPAQGSSSGSSGSSAPAGSASADERAT
jgi:RecA-family ATPase